MRGWAMAALAASVALAGSSGAQGPVDPSAPMPPGHPPVAGSAQAPQLPPGHPPATAKASPSSALPPPGHPDVSASAQPAASAPEQAHPPQNDDAAEAAGTPPGHPEMGSSRGTAAASPHDGSMLGERAPADTVGPAVDLPPGTVEVRLLDGANRPIAGKPLKLVQLKSSVAEGDSSEEFAAISDEEGKARFTGLAMGTAFSYRAATEEGPATYATDAFRLEDSSGNRATLHVYPVVRDLKQALIGMRAVIYISPRDDIFQIEQQYQVFNLGRITWVPENQRIALPTGAKAFSATESMTDAEIKQIGDGQVALMGTFPPGQRELTYRFQLDNDHTRTRSLRLGLPPHVAELRVISEAGPDFELEVNGFPEAQAVRGRDGNRLLVTGQQLTRGQPPLDSIQVTLAGLPVPSLGRWYAVGLALFFAVGGLWSATGRGSRELLRGARRDLDRAHALLLEELVVLEQVHRQGDVGPRTYEQTRSALMSALARIDVARQRSETTTISTPA